MAADAGVRAVPMVYFLGGTAAQSSCWASVILQLSNSDQPAPWGSAELPPEPRTPRQPPTPGEEAPWQQQLQSRACSEQIGQKGCGDLQTRGWTPSLAGTEGNRGEGGGETSTVRRFLPDGGCCVGPAYGGCTSGSPSVSLSMSFCASQSNAKAGALLVAERESALSKGTTSTWLPQSATQRPPKASFPLQPPNPRSLWILAGVRASWAGCAGGGALLGTRTTCWGKGSPAPPESNGVISLGVSRGKPFPAGGSEGRGSWREARESSGRDSRKAEPSPWGPV